MKVSSFLKRAAGISGKMTSSQFLTKHRAYLSGFPSVLRVLASYEQGLLLPTPCLTQVLTLLALERDPEDTVIETIDHDTGEITSETVAKAEDKKAKKAPKKYVVFIFVDGGKEVSECFTGDDYGDTERKAHRRMFNDNSACYATIVGMGVSTKITREASLKAIINGKIGGRQAIKDTTSKNGSFSVGKAKSSVSYFSGA